jgi:hypothetical protein
VRRVVDVDGIVLALAPLKGHEGHVGVAELGLTETIDRLAGCLFQKASNYSNIHVNAVI